MATQVIGSFAINDLVTIAAHAAGSLNFGPIAVPKGYTILTITFDLQQVNSLTAVFAASAELSFDNGVNWISLGGGGLDLAQSGYVLNAGVLTRPAADPKGPGPVRVFAVQRVMTQCDLTTRQVRGVVSCTEAVISGVTLTAF